VLALVFSLTGCTHWQSGVASTTHGAIRSSPVNFDTPSSLIGFDHTLTFVAVLGFGALIVGGVLWWFTPPASHGKALMLAAAGGLALGLSLLLKVMLWLIPWIAGALLLAGLVWLGLELWERYGAKKKPTK
jgi:hypothetical protein